MRGGTVRLSRAQVLYPRGTVPGSAPLEIPARAVVRPGVGIDARRLQVGMPERLRHERDRGAAVDRVRSMSVPQPVGRGRGVDAGALGRGRHDVTSSGSMLTGARVHHGLKRPRPENPRIPQPGRGHVHNCFGERFLDVLVQVAMGCGSMSISQQAQRQAVPPPQSPPPPKQPQLA